jgi:hypothetical protein
MGSGAKLLLSGVDLLSSLSLAGCSQLDFLAQNATLDSFGFSLRALGGGLG